MRRKEKERDSEAERKKDFVGHEDEPESMDAWEPHVCVFLSFCGSTLISPQSQITRLFPLRLLVELLAGLDLTIELERLIHNRLVTGAKLP